MKQMDVPKKNQLDLLHFRMRLAESLVKMGKCNNLSKRGRPNKSSLLPLVKRSKLNQEVRPISEIRYDMTDHMPFLDDNKEGKRCKNNCNKRTHFYCDKCKVHLCLTKKKNCFASYHRK